MTYFEPCDPRDPGATPQEQELRDEIRYGRIRTIPHVIDAATVTEGAVLPTLYSRNAMRELGAALVCVDCREARHQCAIYWKSSGFESPDDMFRHLSQTNGGSLNPDAMVQVDIYVTPWETTLRGPNAILNVMNLLLSIVPYHPAAHYAIRFKDGSTLAMFYVRWGCDADCEYHPVGNARTETCHSRVREYGIEIFGMTDGMSRAFFFDDVATVAFVRSDGETVVFRDGSVDNGALLALMEPRRPDPEGFGTLREAMSQGMMELALSQHGTLRIKSIACNMLSEVIRHPRGWVFRGGRCGDIAYSTECSLADCPPDGVEVMLSDSMFESLYMMPLDVELLTLENADGSRVLYDFMESEDGDTPQ